MQNLQLYSCFVHSVICPSFEYAKKFCEFAELKANFSAITPSPYDSVETTTHAWSSYCSEPVCKKVVGFANFKRIFGKIDKVLSCFFKFFYIILLTSAFFVTVCEKHFFIFARMFGYCMQLRRKILFVQNYPWLYSAKSNLIFLLAFYFRLIVH